MKAEELRDIAWCHAILFIKPSVSSLYLNTFENLPTLITNSLLQDSAVQQDTIVTFKSNVKVARHADSNSGINVE